MRNVFFPIIAAATLLTACQRSFVGVPPSDIGMMLTPTGYEDRIYTPGQVDIGDADQNGRANRLVLIQRSGIEVKEQFVGAEASDDHEDHRCMLLDQSPMTLDVRLLMALPNYETADGKRDLARVFMLGNPTATQDPSARVDRITAESIYASQAQQVVRGRIRQICTRFKNFDEAFKAFSDTSENGLAAEITKIVAEVLQLKNVPLQVVSAFPSNMKPDPSVIAATTAQKAATERVKAIEILTQYLDGDRTGSRRLVYEMQVLQEIVSSANNNGHNTIVLTPGASGGQVSFLNAPQARSKPAPVAEASKTKEEAPAAQ